MSVMLLGDTAQTESEQDLMQQIQNFKLYTCTETEKTLYIVFKQTNKKNSRYEIKVKSHQIVYPTCVCILTKVDVMFIYSCFWLLYSGTQLLHSLQLGNHEF